MSASETEASRVEVRPVHDEHDLGFFCPPRRRSRTRRRCAASLLEVGEDQLADPVHHRRLRVLALWRPRASRRCFRGSACFVVAADGHERVSDAGQRRDLLRDAGPMRAVASSVVPSGARNYLELRLVVEGQEDLRDELEEERDRRKGPTAHARTTAQRCARTSEHRRVRAVDVTVETSRTSLRDFALLFLVRVLWRLYFSACAPRASA